MQGVRSLAACLVVLTAGGCALPAQQASAQVKGSASYRERMALPPNAVFEATLEDVSRADAKAEVIGSVRIERPGNPPIAFEIPYDPARIEERRRYTVRARILVDGKLVFITDQHTPVLTGGKGQEVTLVLRRVRDPVPDTSLENTYWKLERLGDKDVTEYRWAREPHFVLHSSERRVGGSGGCNRLAGSYELDGERLAFGRLAGTLMACQEGMEVEREFLTALRQVRKARVSGEELQLFDAEDKPVARFEARYMK